MAQQGNAANLVAATQVDWLLRRLVRCDGEAICKATAVQIRQWIIVVERHLARERNKGLSKHWSYDLNRHIALKSARDRLRQAMNDRKTAPAESARLRKRGAAIEV